MVAVDTSALQTSPGKYKHAKANSAVDADKMKQYCIVVAPLLLQGAALLVLMLWLIG
jgi:hypothetical protein